MEPSTLKRLIRRTVNPSILGWLDYYRFPHFANSWGGPFNGQQFRQQIFRDLLQAIRFDLIVETGTYRGTTTEYMATVSRLPVFTVEADARNYGYSRARLVRFSTIEGTLEDSRVFLNRLLQGNKLIQKTPFFYLDAHWNADLPLFEELRLIFEKCTAAVVMIDDFQVPDDSQYQYDDSLKGKELALPYIAPLVESLSLAQYYPSACASEETGLRRGCVVLARRDSGHVKSMACVSSLRSWPDNRKH